MMTGPETRLVLTGTVIICRLPGTILRCQYPGSCDVISVSILSTTVSAGHICAHITNTHIRRNSHNNLKWQKIKMSKTSVTSVPAFSWIPGHLGKNCKKFSSGVGRTIYILISTVREYCSGLGGVRIFLNLAPKFSKNLRELLPAYKHSFFTFSPTPSLFFFLPSPII